MQSSKSLETPPRFDPNGRHLGESCQLCPNHTLESVFYLELSSGWAPQLEQLGQTEDA